MDRPSWICILTQSSGTGKTRLLLEAASLHPIIYINCKEVQKQSVSKGFEFLKSLIMDISPDRVVKESELIKEKSGLLKDFFKAISFWMHKRLLRYSNKDVFNEADIRKLMFQFLKIILY